MQLDPNPPARKETGRADADRPTRQPSDGTDLPRGLPLEAYQQIGTDKDDGKPPMRYVPPPDMGGD